MRKEEADQGEGEVTVMVKQLSTPSKHNGSRVAKKAQPIPEPRRKSEPRRKKARS